MVRARSTPEEPDTETPDDGDDSSPPDEDSTEEPASSLDPMLVNPEKVARERVSGSTSDALNRVENARASDVKPDAQVDAVKSSDAGAEAYPFPPQGDVDVATVDPGSGEGESMPALTAEDWVILDGSSDAVPDRLDGRPAVVLSAPAEPMTEENKDDYEITVRTRDDVNATLTIPLSAVKSIDRGGRNPTVRG
jgi:hypothetical protein